eukprot:TRINITY_DN6298_c0_g1_i2.p2 TRINITY_DN6298_c0_g1~~TRINITY_DN6298_c0_g1_i2.p2  ORF type:complete len:284 (-),score=97.36 TRINITY_DN6298_c0_g1_i2:578-1429(-)
MLPRRIASSVAHGGFKSSVNVELGLAQCFLPNMCSRCFFSTGRNQGIPSPNFVARPLPFSKSFQMPRRGMFIQTQNTPNPESLKFLPGQPVLGKSEDGVQQTRNFTSLKSAQPSPLARALFQIEGVKGVFYGADFITVTKTEDAEWSFLKPSVFAAIMDFYASGKDLVVDEAPAADTAVQPEDDEVVAMIKEIIETRVRPAVQEDGGDILYKGFTDGVVLLKMQGSCSGCPSSAVTLKSGIEKMLMHWVPEVVSVVAVDDDDLDKLNLEAFNKFEKKHEAATA